MSIPRRVTIVTGHYGSGKSEFSINLALVRARESAVALADVDVVNPYFRSREQRRLLESHGIRVAGNALGIDTGVDLPSIAPEVLGLVRDPAVMTIVDSGGDPAGARVLGILRRLLDPFDTEVLCVINGSRRDTGELSGAVAMIRALEAASGLAVTGLVNNTHMLEHTTIRNILDGDLLCREIREETGIPVRYTGIPHWLLPEGDTTRYPGVEGDVIPVMMYLRESWMATPARSGGSEEEHNAFARGM